MDHSDPLAATGSAGGERLFAQQACNECRRRKGRCDRVSPECGTCVRYNRHCLYTQDSKSPLTRKHLTYVEHRLEAATAEIRMLRRKLAAVQGASTSSTGSQSQLEAKSSSSLLAPSGTGVTLDPETHAVNVIQGHEKTLPLVPATDNELAIPHIFQDSKAAVGGDESPPIRLEWPPAAKIDFDWNEQGVPITPGALQLDEGDNGLGFIDGMASLSVNEEDAGYLGVASGAALLRMLQLGGDNTSSKSAIRQLGRGQPSLPSLSIQPDANMHVIDAMIDGYFRTYHVSYPIVHEPRFKAQHAEVIARPEGNGWKALVYIVAALGAFSASTEPTSVDGDLFNLAKSHLSIDDLESGNTSLVQALALMSNYLQKRNKPNSGYNYLGLALRMAMGLGLHKEFPRWEINPLELEIRRRVWWSLFVFDVGATITFSRPLGWPTEGIEVALPLNVHDRHLTATASSLPENLQEITIYSAMRTQVSFHQATNLIYTRVISSPFPSPQEVLLLDQKHIVPWLASLPAWYNESAVIPSKYALGHAIMMWRYRNFRLIMYRPFVIRRVLRTRSKEPVASYDDAEQAAYSQCLIEAKASICAIHKFWSEHPHTNLAAWYSLYFLFQASLLPIFCLRNMPLSENALSWRQDIELALNVIESMFAINSSSLKCYDTIHNLCGDYLAANSSSENYQMTSTQESPQTQISNVYSMMWPNVPAVEADVVMQDEAWLRFLSEQPLEQQVMGDADFTEGQWDMLSHP
ncbi:hypothetical protein BP5796_07071 [Coleophoma crateriformis]|uniref:Zn(2)-C6 fungal-type domain-containing protein n=1 Tax=Coleophoma crateriformis TaxID=565419 RepID=A0A3D8RHU3_9HELO|nr:hypothetical protein BP5796_07071 [Coleophoma crateriformis]